MNFWPHMNVVSDCYLIGGGGGGKGEFSIGVNSSFVYLLAFGVKSEAKVTD